MTFNPSLAVLYGRFIQAAYTMYDANHNNLTPAKSHDFPLGYQLTAWVQMHDFLLGSMGPVFYGFIAHSESDPNSAILAIRGTRRNVEWWDNANSMTMQTFNVAGYGNVGVGWERIYETLEVVRATASGGGQQSLKGVGRFAAQVNEHLQHHAVSAGSPQTEAASHAIAITGHSLGAALAILCAAENKLLYKADIQALYTFASPKMGDHAFVNMFNGLGLESWRIVNKQDIVPKLPLLLFEHVNNERLYDSMGSVHQSDTCNHSLATYMHLIDSTVPLDLECQLPGRVAATSVRVG
jgi:predicted lipase